METVDIPDWAALEMEVHLERLVQTRAITKYAPLVVDGVKLLNKQLLPTWLKKITLTNLELNDGQRCVLGQLAAKSAIRSAGYELYGDDYEAAIAALGIEGDDFGFNVNCRIDNENEFDDDQGMYALNHLWVTAIKILRKGEKVTEKSLLAKVIY